MDDGVHGCGVGVGCMGVVWEGYGVGWGMVGDGVWDGCGVGCMGVGVGV